jgi:uncharacterized membrane protein
MNYTLLSGIFLVLLFFTLGVKQYTNPTGFRSFIGYRSQFSLKNEDTWYAANMFAGLLLMVMAVILLLLLLFLENEYRDQSRMLQLIFTYFIAVYVFIYYLTERKLRRIFHRDGKRRAGSL